MGRVIALASGKGGVGKTMLTACLAESLVQEGKQVLLIDASITNRGLDLLYRADDQSLFDLGDALGGRCRPSQTVQRLNDSLSLIPAPLREETFAQEDLHQFFHLCAQDYDVVLVDCPSGAGRQLISLARSADTVYLIVTPELLSARSASTLATVLTPYPELEQGMIINRLYPAAQQGDYSVDRLIDMVKLPCLGVVPQDARFLTVSQSGGVPSSGAAVNACARIAARLLGQQIPLPKGRKLFA